jgi:hypothetical protein
VNVINKSKDIYPCSLEPTPSASNGDDNDVTIVMSNKSQFCPTDNPLPHQLPSQFVNSISIATTQAIADTSATSIFLM